MIYLGADHGGYHLKEKIKKWLTEWGYEWEDLGNKKFEPGDDYPKFAFKVAKKVAEEENSLGSPRSFSLSPKLAPFASRPSGSWGSGTVGSLKSLSSHANSKKSFHVSVAWNDRPKGILACRSAAGMVMAANKVKGIRAAAAFDKESARHSRTNNDANILAISGDWMDDKGAKEVLKEWLTTEFSGEERHKRRLEEIKEYEG